MESESNTKTMRCKTCYEEYDPCEAGTCNMCYEMASEAKEQLLQEFKELERAYEQLDDKVAFLRLWSPVDQAHRGSPDPVFPDVVLVAPDDGLPPVPVPAHKAVLVNRSPVFKAMLEHEMEESRSGTIKISGVSYDVLRAFVNYLYTAEAWLDKQMACDLLVFAEKYQVNHLKGFCEKFLVSKLNWDNSLWTYAFAHQHGAKLLLDAAFTFITHNIHNLTKTKEYKELVEKDARLVVEIYEAFLSKRLNTTVFKYTSKEP
ncbi:hypothetical protein V6N13_051077 [Hibiscus sabdariffa]|uniref:BTB domain-containing protein n=1 Tax=Hibiscus sabdariffa TaxID=183260 RepID=A0ABR2T2K6_9ROSI